MVNRKDATRNMGQFNMTVEEARNLIDRARKGQPVDPLDLQRATMVAYKGKEPRKLFMPVLTRAERMEKNAVLLHNLGNARYQQLKESLNVPSEDEPSPLREAGALPD